MTEDRLPPSDQESERALLGSILRCHDLYDDAAMILNAEQFYAFPNRVIFSAMGELRSEGKGLDPQLVAVRLRECGKIEDAPPAYFVRLWEEAPPSGNVKEYAAVVKQHAMARALITACNEILKDAWAPGANSAWLIETAERRIFAIAQGDLQGEAVPHSRVLDESIELLTRRVNLFRRGEMIGAVPYGLKDLDKATAGMHAGELVIIGARPGVGKTIFGCHLADVAGSAQLPTLFISLEQARHELALRLLSKRGQVNAFKIRGGTVTDLEYVSIEDAAGASRALPIWWDDSPCQSVSRISAQARRLRSKHGLALLVVDYMQLIDAPDKRQKRYEAVGEMSRSLKLLARDLKIPVVAMAQLNREAEQRGGEPKLSDLREAGGIEQDADTVILMHQPKPDDKELFQELKLLIRKQRNGPLSSITVLHDKAHYALVNASSSEGTTF